MEEKVCFKCQKQKPLSDFYKHRMMVDGHLNKCKECTKRDSRKNRASNIEYYREYDRARGNRQSTEKIKERRIKNPQKYQAQTAVNNAIRDGRLFKKPCEVCGSLCVHGHHNDYSRPLDVRWLCPVHHKEAHKND